MCIENNGAGKYQRKASGNRLEMWKMAAAPSAWQHRRRRKRAAKIGNRNNIENIENIENEIIIISMASIIMKQMKYINISENNGNNVIEENNEIMAKISMAAKMASMA
jgi:hypothetical protein